MSSILKLKFCKFKSTRIHNFYANIIVFVHYYLIFISIIYYIYYLIFFFFVVLSYFVDFLVWNFIFYAYVYDCACYMSDYYVPEFSLFFFFV